MAIWRIFKVSRKTFVDPGSWVGSDSIKEQNQTIWSILKDIFVSPEAPVKKETFEEAAKRLELTEEDIKQARANYYFYAILFAVLGAATALFSLYLLFFHLSFYGLLLAAAASGLFFAQAFRFHFWYFQIKHRKLGCTFDEWWSGKPSDKGSSS
ncbi:type IVB secretion system protein IcmV [Aquicella lusitana]|mgnify:CR=1 FL=1|uniref:Intracellular multiplication protein IcmV n=1 Tax=Aquicella lusitana TaxID=254246 RepID=A0A370GEQ5_9COXI|nr:type IVB secretion system protein IcmV [Aquicella lusitana]RDI41686.1 intracellular multiplication protein IcmV [Aquicella lusitana]VVC72662.1 hypothetical protein AQULUS_03760 [Aquicella lusitana]